MDPTTATADTVELLPNGRLMHLADWNRSVAERLAGQDGITLTEEHWKIIILMRRYYEEFGISPVRKLLRKTIAHELGAKFADEARLERLFPNDVLIQGTKIAGIPIPYYDADLDEEHYFRKPAPKRFKLRHFVDEFEFDGRKYKVYPNGNLVHPADWNERLAEHMARAEGIELTEEHWEIIRFLRAFYFEYGIAPMVRLLEAHLSERFGAARYTEEYLYRLFPGGPARQGCRIAGLPEPQGCIDP